MHNADNKGDRLYLCTNISYFDFDYFIIFFHPTTRHHITGVSLINPADARFTCLSLWSRSIVLSVSSLCLVLLLPFRHPFCFPGSRLLSSRISYSDFETTPVIGFHISGRQEIGLKLLCCKLCCLFRIFNAQIRFEIGMPFCVI